MSSSQKTSEPETSASSYSQILKSSSVIGGAQGINYVIGMVRTKVIALLLGPAGIGMIGIYTSAISMLTIATGLGMGSSGVREIAKDHAAGNEESLSTTVTTLRRACWFTGILGWIICGLLAYPMSQWTFQNSDHIWAYIFLGSTLLISAIASGQSAILQGTRRIREIAIINVSSALISTILSIIIYGINKDRGIVPVLIVTALVNLAVTYCFVRSIKVARRAIPWFQSIRQSKALISLGLAFMWSALLAAVISLIIRSAIVEKLGIEANGLFQAAWGLSGLFAGFILSAMGTDFYPRLVGLLDDKKSFNLLLNQQSEIGLLLALPGITATIAYAPWVMKLFYSSRFVAGAELLPWLILGVYGRVVSWPLGYGLMASGSKSWYIVAETLGNFINLILSIILIEYFGLIGAAMAYPICYLSYTIITLFASYRISEFKWSYELLSILMFSTLLILSTYLATFFVKNLAFKIIIESILVIAACGYSLHGLLTRSGLPKSITERLEKISCLKLLLKKITKSNPL